MTDIGNPIKFSFVEDFPFNVYTNKTANTVILITPPAWPILYNGQFKKYTSTFMSTNIPYEMFTLDGLNPDTPIPTYIDHNNFHVYIEHVDEDTGKISYTEWKQVNNLVSECTYNTQAYELRLDENKNYTIKFRR